MSFHIFILLLKLLPVCIYFYILPCPIDLKVGGAINLSLYCTKDAQFMSVIM